MTHFLFYFFACGALVSAVFCIGAQKPGYNLIGFLGLLLNLTFLIVNLNAEFYALMLLNVYVHTIIIFILFFYKMTVIRDSIKLNNYVSQKYKILVSILMTMLGLEIIFLLFFKDFSVINLTLSTEKSHIYSYYDIKSIGNVFYTNYCWAFQILGFIQFISIMSAILIIRNYKISKSKMFMRNGLNTIKLHEIPLKKGIDLEK